LLSTGWFQERIGT